MVTRSTWASALSLALLTVSFGAAAEPLPPTPAGTAPAAEKPAPAPAARPKIHHAPVVTTPAHQALTVRADIEHPHLVKRALLVYRTAKNPAFREVELLRASSGPYAAEVPEDDVEWPSLSYTLELELLSGRRVAAFASRGMPHSVQVPEDLMDIRERALSERLGGRRSVFSATGEYVSFGKSDAASLNQTGTESVRDQYFRLEGGYTYRPLRVVTEFSMRIGMVRGQAPVPVRAPVPGQSVSERFDVGLNYLAPTVRFRLHDQIHVEGELLGSLTEVGFSAGGGGALLLGDPYGSKLTLGFEKIQIFGSRFFTRMDVVATDRVIVAPIVEITNMPSAEKYGVRLLGEVALDLGSGFGAALRGGYQARLATSGGPSAGATMSYSF